jgi:hypothetical protein
VRFIVALDHGRTRHHRRACRTRYGSQHRLRWRPLRSSALGGSRPGRSALFTRVHLEPFAIGRHPTPCVPDAATAARRNPPPPSWAPCSAAWGQPVTAIPEPSCVSPAGRGHAQLIPVVWIVVLLASWFVTSSTPRWRRCPDQPAGRSAAPRIRRSADCTIIASP